MKTFTKENLTELFALLAIMPEDELKKGFTLNIESKDDLFDIFVSFNNRKESIKKITLKAPKTKRKATAEEWLIWACSADALGWVVKDNNVVGADFNVYTPQNRHYKGYEERELNFLQRAKIENGKIGDFDFFWIEELKC